MANHRLEALRTSTCIWDKEVRRVDGAVEEGWKENQSERNLNVYNTAFTVRLRGQY